jgi:hypothetical protein
MEAPRAGDIFDDATAPAGPRTVLRIDDIQVFKRFKFSNGEKVDCKGWRNGARSFVLVACPERDRLLSEYLLDNASAPAQRAPFDATAHTHPAQVELWLRVEYVTVDAAWHAGADESARMLGTTVAHRAASQPIVQVAALAVCDFFCPHPMRETWPMAGSAELWSSVFFVSNHSSALNDSFRLVPAHRIAGKFARAVLSDTEQIQLSVNTPFVDDGGQLGPSADAMIVLRFPMK